MEEVGLIPDVYEKVAEIQFCHQGSPDNVVCHTYLCKAWKNEPAESDEMKPQWFDLDKIPYTEMWEDDTQWLPLILRDKKFRARFDFEGDKLSKSEIVLGL